MTARILLKVIALVCIVVAAGYQVYVNANSPHIVQAVGDLNVIWGVPDGSPIFTVAGMLPGDRETRSVVLENNGTIPRPVTIRGKKTDEYRNFSDVLEITVSQEGTDLYGGDSGIKTLARFFADSTSPTGIPLSTIPSGSQAEYVISVRMQESAENEYQGAWVTFKITFGIAYAIPTECRHMRFSGEPIYGTSGNDHLKGTIGNDLIISLEGNDTVKSYGGDDCIIGGPGNDIVDAGMGDDYISGGEGNDKITGGMGNDILSGGDGNDVINAGMGDDRVSGDNGNDVMTGDMGNDHLIGGPGKDTAHGGMGWDICDAESEKSCER